jgi:hypothetical protein
MDIPPSQEVHSAGSQLEGEDRSQLAVGVAISDATLANESRLLNTPPRTSPATSMNFPISGMGFTGRIETHRSRGRPDRSPRRSTPSHPKAPVVSPIPIGSPRPGSSLNDLSSGSPLRFGPRQEARNCCLGSAVTGYGDVASSRE